jgi:Fur family ferric uptake transcriptional regulator
MINKDLDKLLLALREQGCRLSGGREILLSVLAAAKGPLSAAEILISPAVKRANINRATVYRALSFLEKENIIESLRLDGDERLYHLNFHHHHHLLCTACKKIEAVHVCGLLGREEKKIAADTGFKVQRHVLEFYGLCKNCAAKKK